MLAVVVSAGALRAVVFNKGLPGEGTFWRMGAPSGWVELTALEEAWAPASPASHRVPSGGSGSGGWEMCSSTHAFFFLLEECACGRPHPCRTGALLQVQFPPRLLSTTRCLSPVAPTVGL